MNTIIKLVPLLVMTVLLFSCSQPTPKDLAKEMLIPRPENVVATGSSFELTNKTVINIENERIKPVANYLSGILQPATGFQIAVKTTEDASKLNGISLILSEDTKGAIKESYSLLISEKKITVKAGDPAGLFMGVQTIRQLLPAKIESADIQTGPWEIATGTIEDAPYYSYRGAMLDVARHFFSVEDVKRFIDLIATYKMNILHLHLSDDQGWRIEIKSWPNLTNHGSKTQVGGGEGGFYTQEQYRDIVEYAQQRFITVIPEIDMPGHTNAALASYPELNADGKATELYSGIEVGFSTLATDKEITYKFVDDVVRELAALTPGEYIHIGGDESHVTAKEDYITFINRIQDIVETHEKTMIGWADIAAATLKPKSIAQFWQKEPDNAIKAVEQNVKIIMSRGDRMYMDMQYDSICRLGLHWAGYIEVDKAYNWNPESLVDGISKEYILGIEAPLWTETIENMDDIEFMVFPRLPGYAELGWSNAKENNWEEYKLRLAAQKERFEFMGINYYQSKLVPW